MTATPHAAPAARRSRAARALRRAASAAWRRTGASRFARSESGAATIEFVVIFPAIFFFITNTVETSSVLTRGAMLDRSLDLAVRQLRLGTETPPTFDEFRQMICDANAFLPDCMDALQIELRPYTAAALAQMQEEIRCVDRSEDIEPVDETNFVPGAANQVMLVRACASVPPRFPQAGLGAALPKDANGDYRITAVSAYVQEP